MSLPLPGKHSCRIAEFRQKHHTGLVTLVFTDIVGSTNIKQLLGDQEGVALIQAHHARYRQLLSEFKEAEEISTAGDSFFLIFAKPSDAVRFALLLQKTFRSSRQDSKYTIKDRIGIHIGEVVILEPGSVGKPNDFLGMQVDLCARVMSLGEGGQILMTRSVMDNARSSLHVPGPSALRWASHGLYRLKHIKEPVEICEVRAVEGPLRPPADAGKVAAAGNVWVRRLRAYSTAALLVILSLASAYYFGTSKDRRINAFVRRAHDQFGLVIICSNYVATAAINPNRAQQFSSATLTNFYASFSSIAKLVRLASLELSGCENLTTMVLPPELKRVESLDLSNCTSLTNLVISPEWTALRAIKTAGCKHLENLIVPAELSVLPESSSLRIAVARC